MLAVTLLLNHVPPPRGVKEVLAAKPKIPRGGTHYSFHHHRPTHKRIQEDTSANPELSWEYWNGKGWWRLDVTLDEAIRDAKGQAFKAMRPLTSPL